MAKRAIGLNTHALFSTANELDELVSYHRTTKPGASVVMDNPGFALRLAQASPETLVIYRRSADDNCHLPETNYVSPQQWAANYLADIPRPHPANLAIYYNNEAGLSTALNDHALACTKQVAPYPDVKVAFLNLSVGVPNYNDWNLMEPFFRYITQPRFRERFFLGLHEYFLPDALHDWGHGADYRIWPTTLPGVGNLGGRWRAFDNWCASKGIEPCEIVITELGYDVITAYAVYQQSLIHTPGHPQVGAPHANVAQWQDWISRYGLGVSWQQYAAESLYRAWKLFYQTPRIRGVCLFCYGGEDGYNTDGTPKWRKGYDYSKSSMPEFLPYLQTKDFTVTITTPPSGLAWPVTLSWGVNMKFRPAPNTSAAQIAVIPANTAVALETTNVQTNNGYVWMNVRYNGAAGWVALGAV